jgi:hypothetical protein
MKTTSLYILLLFCLLFQPKARAQSELDYSGDQIAGYICTGLGISTIAYTALGYNDSEGYNNKSAVFYSIGTGLLITGIYLLVRGEKKEPYQYKWKGPGPVPGKFTNTLNYTRYLFDDTALQ